MSTESESLEQENEQVKEPDDYHVHGPFFLYKESMDFFLKSLDFYAKLVETELEVLKNDEDFAFLLSEDNRSSPLLQSCSDAFRVKEWFESQAQSCRDAFGLDVYNLSHKTVRFLKSVGQLYINHLRLKRNRYSMNKNLSMGTLRALDLKIAEYEEKTRIGVFGSATLLPLLVEQAVMSVPCQKKTSEEPPEDSLSRTDYPSPLILDSIPLLDSELRERCFDIFSMLASEGKHERLDTVVSEATKIFEDRLRFLSGADEGECGMALVGFALGKKPPRIRLSSIETEQDAWCQLFRGIFGAIRNSTHHRFVKDLTPERALQILGLIDYLLFSLEGAEKRQEV